MFIKGIKLLNTQLPKVYVKLTKALRDEQTLNLPNVLHVVDAYSIEVIEQKFTSKEYLLDRGVLNVGKKAQQFLDYFDEVLNNKSDENYLGDLYIALIIVYSLTSFLHAFKHCVVSTPDGKDKFDATFDVDCNMVGLTKDDFVVSVNNLYTYALKYPNIQNPIAFSDADIRRLRLATVKLYGIILS